MRQPCFEYNDSCSKVIYQTVDVGLPISLTPTVDLGTIKVNCCGEPRIELSLNESGCGRWELRITQTVTYKIPIEYSIKSDMGDLTSEIQKS